MYNKKTFEEMELEDHYKNGSGCRYGQPDGLDDFINECDCFEEE